MSAVFNFTFVPWFRSVAPYIHKFRNQTFVIGLPGEGIAAGKLHNIAQDLALIQAMGVRIVLVHGFRPQVNEQLAAKGHAAKYSHGIRITDSVALDCAQEAAGQLRYEIEAAFSQGLPNTPMAGATVRVISGNFLTARPVGIVDGVDFQNSALVRKVDVAGIQRALDMGALVLLSPFGFSPTGEAFNLAMEEVATSVAIELRADKLIFLTEVSGIRMQPGEPAGDDNPIDTELPLAAAQALLATLPTAQQPTPSCSFKSGQIILQQPIERTQMSKLLQEGKTDLLDKFVSNRTRRAFKAFLVWDKEAGKVGFEFEQRESKYPARKTNATKTGAARAAGAGAAAKKASKTATPKAPRKTTTASGKQPSAQLAAVIGSEPVARPEAVKKLWDYIKANNLQNPADKRVIVADDKLRAIFGKDSAGMFELTGLLGPHLG